MLLPASKGPLSGGNLSTVALNEPQSGQADCCEQVCRKVSLWMYYASWRGCLTIYKITDSNSFFIPHSGQELQNRFTPSLVRSKSEQSVFLFSITRDQLYCSDSRNRSILP